MKSLRWIIGTALCVTFAPSVFAACKISRIGELPVRVEGNRLLVDAQINGQSARVMVDTGAAMTSLWQDAAARLGLPQEKTTNTRLFGIGGEARVLGTTVDRLQMGSFVGDHMHLAVVGTRPAERRPPGDLVLGDDFFSHFTTEFDLAHGAIRLLQTEGCQTQELPYWATTYALAELERLNPENAKIEVFVLVNGKRVRALLDTGAPISFIVRQAAESVGVVPGQAGTAPVAAISGIAGKPVQAWMGSFATFSIGDESMRNVQLRIGDLFSADRTEKPGSRLPQPLEESPSMLIGSDFFLSHRILVLAKEHTLLFTYNGGPVFQLVKSIAPQKNGSDQKDTVPSQTAPAAAH
jgi:clan AA aspartic protease (TIGR02281 family)